MFLFFGFSTISFGQSSKRKSSNTQEIYGLKKTTKISQQPHSVSYPAPSIKDAGSNRKTNQVSSPSKFVRANNETILQELYSIGDERHRIENNQGLSTSERSSQIVNNKNIYNAKRSEFKNFIKTEGVLNVSLNEQRFYLSILKDDKQEAEYKRVVELIKKSK